MEELEDGIVFRLAFLQADFPPNSPHISLAHLRPSPKDLARAEEAGHAPLVTVFDAARTTVDQAVVIRNIPTPTVPFFWNVDKIIAIGSDAWPRAFRVFREELLPPDNGLPGADGHCGLEGLQRPPDMPIKLFKEFREELRKMSRPPGRVQS